MIKNNYHTHTSRCGHAIGEDEEYVIEAIAMGLQELGFSDHIMLPDHIQPGVRGDYDLLDDYCSSINALKEKYKDRIKIYLGFEAEAMEYYFPYYQELLTSGKIQYLILGNHCEIDGPTLKPFFSHATTKDDIKRYTDSLIKGMESGLFKYVCHPDYFMASYLKWDHAAISCSKRIIKASVELGIPLEFNFASIRGGKRILGDDYRYPYPHVEFWKLAKKYGAQIILGLDAHAPFDLDNPNNDSGYKLVKELGLKVIDKLDIDNVELTRQ